MAATVRLVGQLSSIPISPLLSTLTALLAVSKWWAGMFSSEAILLSFLPWAVPGVPFPYPYPSPSVLTVMVTIHLLVAALVPYLVGPAHQDPGRTRNGRYRVNGGKAWQLHGRGGLLDYWHVLLYASFCWSLLFSLSFCMRFSSVHEVVHGYGVVCCATRYFFYALGFNPLMPELSPWRIVAEHHAWAKSSSDVFTLRAQFLSVICWYLLRLSKPQSL